MIAHLTRFWGGFFLYWSVAMLLPTRWWMYQKSLFWWAVPYVGYYAYHPLKWYQPMEMNSGRGGKRVGAGRPKVEDKRITLTITLRQSYIDWLDEQQGSRGDVVEKLIKKAQ